MIDLIDVNNETSEFFDHFVSRIVWLSQHYHQIPLGGWVDMV